MNQDKPVPPSVRRDGNNRRAFTPEACRRRYAHWSRQYAITEVAARREAQQRRPAR